LEKVKRTHETYCLEVKTLTNDEYEVGSNYIKSTTKITMKHKICGYKWDIAPITFLRGVRCPQCQHRSYKKTHDEFVQEVFNLVKNEYSVLSKYINTATHILMKHNICEHEYYVTPNNFLHGYRCPICGNKNTKIKQTKKHNIFVQEVYSITNNEYSVLGKYKNNKTPILMKHNNNSCNNHEWFIIPNNFLCGSRCPVCNESKGEKEVRYYLEKLKLYFVPQYYFSNLLSDKGNPLKFDFGVLDDNNLKLLIEYDGEGHYRDNIFGKYSYERTIKHDQMKNIYCKKNNILLLRIPYWEFNNIENILDNYLKSLNIKLIA